MASTTKSELILALEQIEREKGVKKDDILGMIAGAVTSALRKHLGKTAIIDTIIDPDTAAITASWIRRVVEKVENPETDLTLEQAQKIKPGIEMGQEIRTAVETEDYARIAAQTAKQVLTQKVREVERDNLYEEFKPKEGELISGNVHRFMERNIIVDLNKTEGILPPREQIRRERYNVGDRIRAVILKVDKAQRGPQVLLSRASPLFMRRLLEMEIPEINEKVVEVLDIARDAGFRAKVVIRSHNPKVDAVGACVGIRGSRIRAVMNELAGERIDLVEWSDDLSVFLGNTIVPAKYSSVRILDKEVKRAEIIVPNEQLSLAIGKDGQNIRLACKLTGWSLEVKSEGQKTEETKAVQESRVADLTELEGVGAKVAEVLVKAGMADIERLATFKTEDLMTLQGIGEKTAAKIIASAKKYMSEHGGAPVDAAPSEAPSSEAVPAAEEPATQEQSNSGAEGN
ncbi:MAG: transcription termination/antitermination protein NusA [Elusimicrobia bacterium]|nr:transcription termination/antitermination protein NusA [Elusimicrobiota bacterium]